MTISKELFTAILAMDSYNRGGQKYGAGIDLTNNGIGTATIENKVEDIESIKQEAFEKGFYAVSYNTTFGKVLSYRGTDTDPGSDLTTDVIEGWAIGGGSIKAAQAKLSAEFLDVVQADNAPGSTILTGHSLGGGLAGFNSQLFGNQAIVFDPMPYLLAVNNLAILYTSDPNPRPEVAELQELARQIYRQSLSTLPDVQYGEIGLTHNATGYYIPGEALHELLGINLIRNEKKYENILKTVGPGTARQNQDAADNVALHGMGALVLSLFSDEMGHSDKWAGIHKQVLKSWFDDRIANLINPNNPDLFLESFGSGTVLSLLAYSAVDTGERIFGDTGIRAMFDDLVDIGGAVAGLDNGQTIGSFFANEQTIQQLTDIAVQYGAALALNRVSGSDVISNPLLSVNATQGVFDLNNSGKVLTIDFSNLLWRDVLQASGETLSYPINIVGKDNLLNSYSNAQGLGPGIFQSQLAHLAREVWEGNASEIYDRFHFLSMKNVPDRVVLDKREYVDQNPDQTHVDVYLGTQQEIDSTGAFVGNYVIGNDDDNLIFGGKGDDILIGRDGKDGLIGGEGSDILFGGAGDDYIDVGGVERTDQFSDIAFGGDGNDTILGDWGRDILAGGDGDDIFIVDGPTEENPAPVPFTSSGVGFWNGFGGVLWGGDGADEFHFSGGVFLWLFLSIEDLTEEQFRNVDYEKLREAVLPYMAENHFSTTHVIINPEYDDTLFIYGDEEGQDLGVFSTQFTVYDHLSLDIEDLLRDPSDIGGTPGDDDLFGTPYDDKITAGDGDDDVRAGGGRDRIVAGTGNGFDFYDGESGIDTIVFPSTSNGVVVNLEDGFAEGDEIDRDELANIENVEGGQGNDTIIGDENDNYLFGDDGDDLIDGRAGNDLLKGGAGEDTFVFALGYGTDSIVDFNGAEDQLDLTATRLTAAEILSRTTVSGYDVIIDLSGPSDATTEEDRLILENTTIDQLSDENLTVINSAPLATDDTGYEVDQGETITISATELLANDSDVDGDALLIASVSTTGTGNVVIDADGNVAFTPDGGFIGEDTFNYTVSDGELTDTGTVTVDVNAATETELPSDAVLGTDQPDYLIGDRNEENTINGAGGDDYVIGGVQGDTLYGGAGRDVVFGWKGDDTLYGGAGNDVVAGGLGNDVLFGGDGDDFIDGQFNDDIINGGRGNDLLVGNYGSDQGNRMKFICRGYEA